MTGIRRAVSALIVACLWAPAPVFAADELVPFGQVSNSKRMVDMGDGSHAELVVISKTATDSVKIEGRAASESAAVGNPVPVAGLFGGVVKTLRTATDGTLRIDPAGTTAQPVTDNAGSLTVDSAQLPAALSGSGNLKAAIVEALPAGTSNIGDVDLASAIPAGTNYIGQVRRTDGTNAEATFFDADSGAGTQFLAGSVLRKVASGGSVELGTSSDPIRTDPTGSTAQPVTDNAGSLTVDTAQLPAALSGSGNLKAAIVEALPAGTANIGDVDVLSGPTGSSALQSQGAGAAGAVVVGNPVLTAGSDGTNARTIKVDAGGAVQVDLESAIPAGTNYIGQVRRTDGTNAETTFFDADSGAGTQYLAGASLRKAASGGSVEAGTFSDPLRTDPTGTTTQPVSGTVTANQGTAAAAANSWRTRLSDGTNDAANLTDTDSGAGTDYRQGVVLRKIASGGSVEAGTASDPLRVDPTGTTAQPITDNSGSLTVDAGTGASALQQQGTAADGAAAVGNPVQIAGKDGSANIQTILTDTGGAVQVDVESGTVSSNQGTAAAVGNSWRTRLADGTNDAANLVDADTGAGTEYLQGVTLRKRAAGGSVEAGTSADPLRTDPTGTTTQPVSGTITANAGTGTFTVAGSGIFTVDSELSSSGQLNLDGVAPSTSQIGAMSYGYNGASWDRTRNSSAGNLSATTQQYALMATRPGDWSVISVPIANTQATASKGAGGAGVRHVCTSITAILAADTTAPGAASVIVNLIDGASGGGVYLWRGRLALPATAGETREIVISGLNIFGTANTAMTLEFSAAGGANTFESVTLTGYSVQ